MREGVTDNKVKIICSQTAASGGLVNEMMLLIIVRAKLDGFKLH